MQSSFPLFPGDFSVSEGLSYLSAQLDYLDKAIQLKVSTILH